MGVSSWRHALLIGGLALSFGSAVDAKVDRRAEIRFGEGAEQTIVSVLSWRDGVPDTISTRRPDGSVLVETWERSAIEAIRFEVEPGSNDAQGSGEVVVRAHGQEQRLLLNYRSTGTGVELEFVDTEDPSIRTTAVAIGLDPPALPGERISTDAWWAGAGGVVVFYVLDRCISAQEDAQEECFDAVEDLCGVGKVKEAEYTGVCGLAGDCRAVCAQ